MISPGNCQKEKALQLKTQDHSFLNTTHAWVHYQIFAGNFFSLFDSFLNLITCSWEKDEHQVLCRTNIPVRGKINHVTAQLHINSANLPMFSVRCVRRRQGRRHEIRNHCVVQNAQPSGTNPYCVESAREPGFFFFFAVFCFFLPCRNGNDRWIIIFSTSLSNCDKSRDICSLPRDVVPKEEHWSTATMHLLHKQNFAHQKETRKRLSASRSDCVVRF